MRSATERDSEGKFRWQTILWSAPKKSGKTRIAALVAAWLADTTGPYAEIYLAANDGKQSEDRILSTIGRCLELNPSLGWQRTKSKIVLPNGSFIEAIPVDPTGQAGANPTFVVFSEMWGYRLEHKERLWAQMTISPARRGRSLRWIETYAGYSGESPVLEHLYELGVKQGRRHPEFPDLPVTVNETAALWCYWETEPRMPWQTEEYYRQEAAILSEAEFRRMHRNEWVTSEEAFVSMIWWDACQEALPPP